MFDSLQQHFTYTFLIQAQGEINFATAFLTVDRGSQSPKALSKRLSIYIRILALIDLISSSEKT